MQILVTAGPTHEPIDQVRFIGNKSSGQMGIAIAQAAAQAGHHTTLLLGPVNTTPQHPNITTFPFTSSDQLKQLLEVHFKDAQILIMTAAVADYKPLKITQGKIPRTAHQPLTITLEPTPDLVASLAQSKSPQQKIIAFALEEKQQLIPKAIAKMKRKKVDAIVANPLATMQSSYITPTYITSAGQQTTLKRQSKSDFAAWLIVQLPSL